MRNLCIRVLAALPIVAPTAIEAQQPQARPAFWGDVSPPTAIAGLTDLHPFAPLEFSRAWLTRIEQVRVRRAELMAAGELDGLSPADAAARGAALRGVLRVPVIPVRYDDVAEPFDERRLAERLFGARVGDTLSYSDYWSEVSSGLLRVEGEVAPWVKLRSSAKHYLPPADFGWSSFGRIDELRREAIANADRTIDFAQFDNDGADGRPNSGDDDGFVDFVAILYAVACPSDGRAGGIWPHRAAMAPYATQDSSAAGGPIRIADYVIMPAVEQEGCGPMHVGVLAHETGHALGLPDLYDYDGSSQGIGAWGLMGSGSHAARYSPAHPSAWEKEQLGWVRTKWLTHADSLISVPPIETSNTVYRVDDPAQSDRYLLLENRQRIGSDRYLPGTGLLTWEIDPERGELGAWNSDERRAAITLVQADGRRDLLLGLRADAGDPFPGAFRNPVLLSHFARWLQLDRITMKNGTINARARLDAVAPALVPNPESIRITAIAGADPVMQRVTVKRVRDTVIAWTPQTRAHWLETEKEGDVLRLTAHPGALAPGLYADTVRLVGENGDVIATQVVSFHIALAGVSQIIATELPWSWGLAVRDGRVVQASYGWDPLGLRPRPRLLRLMQGETHPATLARLPSEALYAPAIDSASGNTYVIAHAQHTNYLYRVSESGDASLVAAGIGDQPAYGVALLPDGSVLVADWGGAVHRVDRTGNVTLYTRVFGHHIYQIATDDRGALYVATFSGTVIKITPRGAVSVFASEFGEGRLVAIATSPYGGVFIAERGGAGQILHISDNGTATKLYAKAGAQFYGLAADAQFVYALDLNDRIVLRVPIR